MSLSSYTKCPLIQGMLSQFKWSKDELSTLEVDWASSDKPICLMSDGTVRVFDIKMSSCSSCHGYDEYRGECLCTCTCVCTLNTCMYMCVSMYMCVYIEYMYVRICVCVYMYMCVYIEYMYVRICVCVYMYVYVCTCISVCTCTCLFTLNTCTCVCIYVCTCTCVYACVHVCISVCVHVHKHVYMMCLFHSHVLYLLLLYYFLEPVFSPYSTLPQCTFRLKSILQHQPWSVEYNLDYTK